MGCRGRQRFVGKTVASIAVHGRVRGAAEQGRGRELGVGLGVEDATVAGPHADSGRTLRQALLIRKRVPYHPRDSTRTVLSRV